MLFIPRHSGNKRSVWRGGGKRSREKKPESRAADVCTLLARYIQSIAPISEKTMLNKPALRAVTGAADGDDGGDDGDDGDEQALQSPSIELP